jgi:hypothetical protein
MHMKSRASPRAPADHRARRRQRRRLSAFFCGIQDVPVKWPFPACAGAVFKAACCPLDSACTLRGGHKWERWNSGFLPQKNF